MEAQGCLQEPRFFPSLCLAIPVRTPAYKTHRGRKTALSFRFLRNKDVFSRKDPKPTSFLSVSARIELPAHSGADQWHQVGLHLDQSGPPWSWGGNQVLPDSGVSSRKHLGSIRTKQEGTDAGQRTAVSTPYTSVYKNYQSN